MHSNTNAVLLCSISSSINTFGNISIPWLGFSQDFTVSADSVTNITLPTMAMVFNSEGVGKQGVQITANDSVNVISINTRLQSTDATMVLPFHLLGKQYIIMSYPFSITAGLGSKSEFLIVATQDSTVVDITLTDSTINGLPPDTTFSVLLQEGEIYQVKSGGDLTGTKIISSKSLAVFGGNICTTIPVGESGCDHLYEQMYPISVWGKDFFAVSFMSRSNGDTYRILASQDSTQITINGNSPFILNKYEYIELIIDSNKLIEASSPIAVAHFSNSASYDGTNYGDPFMIILSSNNQTISSAMFSTITGGNNNIQNHFLNIITKTSNINSIKLDSTSITESLFDSIPYSLYSTATIPISEGTHIINADSGIIAYVYGFGNYESYGHKIGDRGEGSETSISEYNFSEQTGIKVYPNPFSCSTTLEINAAVNYPVNFILYDQLGREVEKKENIKKPGFTFKRNGISRGIYFYSVEDKNQKVIGRGKLLIQ